MSRLFSAGNSKQLTASGVVTTEGKAGVLLAYCIKCGTTDTNVEFRDGGVAGTIRWEDGMNGEAAAGEVYVRLAFPIPIAFSTDIYAVITGTGAEVTIEYVETEA